MRMLTLTAVALSALSAHALGQCGSTCSSQASTARVVAASNDHHAADIVDTAVAAGNFKTLAAALKAADLVDALKGDGPFTVFAPTDEAFAKLPKGTVETLLKPENKKKLQAILLYHVVEGELTADQVTKHMDLTTLNGQRAMIGTDAGVSIDNATILATDIMASNGVIHVIDEVILPETKTIPAIAKDAGQFKTLLAAIDAAGLTETLLGEGPFTVFAPTDEAFNALPSGTVESLLEPRNRHKLQEILTYHVVPGRVYADDAVKLDTAKTVEGSTINIAFRDGSLFINRSEVVAADIEASNGVIHIIDAVLLP
jgi:transforming growth factor-beta-induced protein